ncbi:ribonucleoside-diphosphate reductase large subunit [Vibrio phage qdvp001]|uniref:ribonucleoside-diphosphate reductase large subunit n=1 Tax=Vibrio phage qdvp001 TaxID=1003177 RepID=UPI000720A08B|nr:ribonucleoside-diphosphate reductase large subunit [Vibrio phage qdvp001]ALM62056.1 putative ribonucleotide-diphosphate reductase alpha subunit [Vibrio phage qdvp001]
MIKNYLGINIDYSKDNIIPEQGYAMLTKKGFYKKEGENSPQESFARAATCYSFGDLELAQRIYDAVSKQWFTFASPVLSNAVKHIYPENLKFNEVQDYLKNNVKPDGLPISCFLSYIPDTRQGLVEASSECRWLSMNGGGVGMYAGMRGVDEKSTGVMAHMKTYDADAKAYKQGETRRGSYAAYLPINHPEILSFIDMRNPVGGDPNFKCFNLNNGINITDDFMMKVVYGEKFELVDPKHGGTGRFLDAREVWMKILEVRKDTGEPYLEFIDTVNDKIPSWITNRNYKVVQSNLCNEIQLMTDENRTAVCCLSSLNLDKYDEWKDTTLVQDLVRLLDNVLEYFIALAPDSIKRAKYSATQERAIGLGTLGFASYLQRHNIPFESGGFNSAVQTNYKLYKDIKQKAVQESLKLGKERGEAPDCEGSGMRNSHLMAIAPNASSSSLVNVSPSIEPFAGIAFTAQGRSGSFLIKNKHFERLLASYAEDNGLSDTWKEEQWASIVANDGSVQNLEWLTDHEKKVFKTSSEINQKWVIEHASIRQPFICQGQSVNLAISPDATAQQVSDLHFLAWKKGLKGLYYYRSSSKVKAKVGDGTQKPLNAVNIKPNFEEDDGECLSCQG